MRQKKVFFVLLVCISLFLGSNLFALDCKKESRSIQETLGFYLDKGVEDSSKKPFKFSFEVHEVREVKVNNLKLCEVVFSLVPKNLQSKPKYFPDMKQIGYLGDGFMIFGDLRVKKGDKVILVTQERSREVNKEFFARIQQEMEKRRINNKELTKKFEGKEKEIKELVDVWLGPIGIKTTVYLFVDPYCPYCRRMKDALLDFVKQDKLRVGLIFVSIGEKSYKVISRALCETTFLERMKIFDYRMTIRPSCEKGENKAKKNNDYFVKMGGRGVPFGIWYKNGKVIYVSRGFIDNNTIKSIIE